MVSFEVVGIGLLVVAVILLGSITMATREKDALNRSSVRTLIPLVASMHICGSSAMYFLFHQYLPLALLFIGALALLAVTHIIYFAKEWVREGRMACVPK